MAATPRTAPNKVPVVEMIDAAAIFVSANRRPVNEVAVTALVESIGKLGLRVPISVRIADEVDIPGEGPVCNVPVLIAGRHRLEATQRLGWKEIPCVVCAGDETDARLWEIAENLHRADLTEGERRQQIAEWVKLTADTEAAAAPCGGSLSDGRRAGKQHQQGVIAKAAKDLGLSADTVARAVAAESLPDEVKAAADLVGLGTVRRAEIARKPAETQLAAVTEPRPAKPIGAALVLSAADLVAREQLRAATYFGIYGEDEAGGDQESPEFLGVPLARGYGLEWCSKEIPDELLAVLGILEAVHRFRAEEAAIAAASKEENKRQKREQRAARKAGRAA